VVLDAIFFDADVDDAAIAPGAAPSPEPNTGRWLYVEHTSLPA
jgi:hypothetical protein